MSELPATRIHVEPEDDWQLFVVRGKLPDGFDYALPIRAKPHLCGETRYYHVHESVTYNNAQWEELTAIFDAHDCCPGERGWWFTEDRFLKFARAVRGLNPDYYTRWPGHKPPRVDPESSSPDEVAIEPEPGLNPNEANFLKKIFHAIPGTSWDVLKIVWMTVRQEAIRQIAAEKKAVDLGFIRLIPVPYRANWKEGLFVRFHQLAGIFRKSPSERHDAMQAAGVYAALTSVKLLAIQREKHFACWTVEAIPSVELERTMDEHEYARAQRTGPVGYAKWLLGAMSKMGRTMEVLKYYADRVFIPFGKIANAKIFGSVKIVASVDSGRVRPGKGLCDQVELRPEEAFEQFHDEPEPETKEPEQELMKVELPVFLRSVPSFRKMIGNGEIEDSPRRPDGSLRRERGAIIEVSSTPNPSLGDVL